MGGWLAGEPKRARAWLTVMLVLLAGVAALTGVAAVTEAADIQSLLRLKSAVFNWAEFSVARNLSGWDTRVPVCSWGGVTCDKESNVVNIDWQCNACAVRAVGTLPADMGRVTTLASLNLQGNSFYGTLPPEWGAADNWPSLAVLFLNYNNLTGTLPPEWGAPSAFPQLLQLRLDNNDLEGELPSTWGKSETSMRELVVMRLGNNRLSGTVPETWGSRGSFRRLQVLGLDNNTLEGTLPRLWGNPTTMVYLQELYLRNNSLTGGLPAVWGLPDALPSLRFLYLSNNPLGGTLPPEWGLNGSFPSLRALGLNDTGLQGTLPPEWGMQGSPGPMPQVDVMQLEHNDLVGSIPAEWQRTTPRLQRLLLRPGNDRMCGPTPANLTFKLCDDRDFTCVRIPATISNTSCPPLQVPPREPLWAVPESQVIARLQAFLGAVASGSPSPSPQPAAPPAANGSRDSSGGATPSSSSSGSSSGSSSFPVAAVAVPVAVVGAAAVALVGFLAVRRRRRRAAAAGGPAEQLHHVNSDKPSEKPFRLEGSDDLEQLEGGRRGSEPPASLLGSPVGGSAASPSLATLPSSALADPERGALVALGSEGTASPAAPAAAVPAVAPLMWSDWEIRPEEIEICKRPDGSDWELGSGGFGKVYKALRNGVQPVAVKVIAGRGDHSMQQGGATLAQRRREIAILRACRDVNILQFVGAHLGPDRTMLVSEYMEGGALSQNIAAGRISWYRRGRKIALDVAKGLVFLHSKRIVHFDLKSPNILVARDGTAKIGDVGMAKIMEMDYVTGVVSTLAWSAPEILWGERCSEKVGIYAFGIVLWEICTGEQPVRGQLRDVRVPEECPPEVRQLTLECLDVSPRKRPSALQLVERLRSMPDAPPPGAAPPRAPPGSPTPPAAAKAPGQQPGAGPPAAVDAAAAASAAGGAAAAARGPAQAPAASTKAAAMSRALENPALQHAAGAVVSTPPAEIALGPVRQLAPEAAGGPSAAGGSDASGSSDGSGGRPRVRHLNCSVSPAAC